jgi:fatty acid desaturase
MKKYSLAELFKSIITWIQHRIFFIIGYAFILYSLWGLFIFAVPELIIGIFFVLFGHYVRKVEHEDREEAE